MKVTKDPTKKIGSKGIVDAENRWWVAELLAADCEKAWLHPGQEKTMQKMICLVQKMKKRKMRRERWKNCINKR